MNGECKGCERSAALHLPEREVQRLLAGYLASHPGERVADDGTYADRLAVCRVCPDVQFGGTTCRHCGCLAAVRAKQGLPLAGVAMELAGWIDPLEEVK